MHRLPHLLFVLILVLLTLSIRSVVDAETRLPIAYANVMVPGTSLGTVANELGEFQLNLPDAADSVRFSAIGYAPMRVARDVYLRDTSFALQSTAVRLSTATVTNKTFRRTKRLGGTPSSDKIVCNFLHGQAGEEMGRRMRSKKKVTAKTATLSVLSVAGETALCRLNFYSIDGDSILSTPLNRQDIFFKITEAGMVNVDLLPFDLELEGDFLMAAQLVSKPVRGQEIIFGGGLFGDKTLYRPHGDADWDESHATFDNGKKFPLSINVGFALQVAY